VQFPLDPEAKTVKRTISWGYRAGAGAHRTV